MENNELSLEQRLTRLEKLFSFDKTGVQLHLSKGKHGVTIGANNNQAYISMSSGTHLVGLSASKDTAGLGVYHKESGDAPVVYFFSDEHGNGKVQCQVNGQIVCTDLGVVTDASSEPTAFEELSQEDPASENPRSRLNATFKPKG